MIPLPRADILMVDDQPENLTAIEAALEPLGERLVRAGSGAEALRHVAHQDFAVILLDVEMPGMNGFEVAERVKDQERNRCVPIIFLTATDTGPVHAVRRYELGAVDSLAKPLDPVVLRSKVSVFVDLFRRTEELNEQARRLQRSFEAITGLREELERARAEADRARERADRASRNLTDFVSRSSHALRTPLNAMLGFAQILETDARDPDQREMAQHILLEGGRLLDLIEESLETLRLEAGMLAPSTERVSAAGETTSPEEVASPPPYTPARRDDRAEGGATGILLYIEDNASNIKLVERLMPRRPNIDLFTTMQGRLGLDLARTYRPDLILLDLHLPDANGDEVLQWLRDDPSTRHIPVVILSADATPAQIQRLLGAGAADYLTKPVDLGRLLGVLDEHMARRPSEAPADAGGETGHFG